MINSIFKGTIYHKRFYPKKHSFTYNVFYLKFSLKNIDSLENVFFSHNKFNFFSFSDCDHGYRNNSSLIAFSQDVLSKNNINEIVDDIVIHTMPRVLGFVFNPVSFFYLKDKNGKHIAVIAEVNNTFGENYSYLVYDSKSVCTKKMQVSPFNKIEGEYEFTFNLTDNVENITINYKVNNLLNLSASINTSSLPWKNSSFFQMFLTFPLNSLSILLKIHYQAIILYFKKVPFIGKNGVVNVIK